MKNQIKLITLIAFLLIGCSLSRKEVVTPGGIRVIPYGHSPNLVMIDEIWNDVCTCAKAVPRPDPPSVTIRRTKTTSDGRKYFWRRDGMYIAGLYWSKTKRIAVLESLSVLGHEMGHHLSYELGGYASGVPMHSRESIESRCGDRNDKKRKAASNLSR